MLLTSQSYALTAVLRVTCDPIVKQESLADLLDE